MLYEVITVDTLVQPFGTGRVGRTEAGLAEQTGVLSVGVEVRREDTTLPFARFQKHGTGTVAKQNTGIAILPVDGRNNFV